MKLSDVVLLKPVQDGQVPPSGLDVETDIFALSDGELSSLPDQITVVGEGGAMAATVSREQLEFIRQACASEYLISVLEDAPIGVVAINDESRIFYANKAYSTVLGVKKQSVLGKYMNKLEPGAAILGVLDGREAVSDRTVWINSVKRHVRVNISPLARNGKPWGAVSFFTDVTESKRLAGELSHAKGLIDHFRQELETQSELPRSFSDIIGKNPNFLRILQTASIAAKTDVALLIQGENGVGKEVLARAIHTASPRNKGPFITVNCAAVPDALLESELFGYEDGAFTGARKGGRMGKFELAHGGVLFLDEIGDMPSSMQAKLLRALQQGEIEKLGRGKTVVVDVRIIAATNKTLEEMVKAGTFRADLYYRLNVVSIILPPLRDRKDDIRALSEDIVAKCGKKYGKAIAISERLHGFLNRYDWPGNIRELSNILEYAVIMCAHDLLLPEHLPAALLSSSELVEQAPPLQSWAEGIAEVEYQMLQKALAATGGNRSQAIRQLGLSRKTFYEKLKKYGMS